MNESLFIVSLDFELLWGVRDKRTIESYGPNIAGVRQVIPCLLQLFDEFGISASFATVGFLFARNKQDLLQYIPSTLPQYGLSKYSPYANGYLDKIGNSEADDIYHYAGTLIDMIRQHPSQEIASHTFSHYYCLENASLESFREDMLAAKKIAAARGIELKTIVFPRNQYSPQHIAICKELGFIGYRGNPAASIYDPRKNEEQSKYVRASRFADSYINISGDHTFPIAKSNDIVNIPASSFLRPFSSKLKALDTLRLKRIKNSMSFAARNRQAYHLWWHPHNFGVNLAENLAFLKQILQHYQKLHHEFGMKSKTMKTIAEEILQPHAI